MKGGIAVSVLVPVYNTADTLARCLRSLADQTLRNIEIICVDDGSDERTKAKLSLLAAEDPRIRVFTHEQNRGSMAARKTGLENARGAYVMFLDSDDEFTPDACEKAYAAIRSARADVAFFGTRPVYAAGVSEEEKHFFDRFSRSYCAPLYGTAIFEKIFSADEPNRIGWTVWNKIYAAPLLQKVLPWIPEERAVMSEDFFINFIALYYARSSAGIEDKLVRYSFGEGISTSPAWKPGKYRDYCAEGFVYRALQKFVDANGLGGSLYEESLLHWARQRARVCAQLYKTQCPPGERAAMLEAFLRGFSPALAAYGLAACFEGEAYAPAEEAARLAAIPCARREIRRVGFFYHRIHNGGVERVLSELIPRFIAWGYETVLFVEETDRDDYPVPDACEVVLLPPSRGVGAEGFFAHARALCRELEERGADVLLYQATTSPWFFYDLLAARLSGVPVVASLHELVSLPLRWKNTRALYAARQYALRCADGVQTLVRSDEAYLRAFGCNVHTVPNPAPAPAEEIAHGGEKAVLWIGRLDPAQKRPEQAILIMEQVVKAVPDARLYLVGRGEDVAVERRCRALIRARGLRKNVRMCGFSRLPDEYYRKASVLLMTSAYEVWGMVLSEAMAQGLPIVSYDMPYLEILKNNGGCAIVPQEDIAGAAAAIVRILQDEGLRTGMAQASLARARELAAVDLRAAWEELFRSLGQSRAGAESGQDLRTGLETMLDFYEKGRQEGAAHAALPPRVPLFRKAAKFWVERGTFALVRRAMLYVYRKLRR